MEFTSLTRRVAELSDIDSSQSRPIRAAVRPITVTRHWKRRRRGGRRRTAAGAGVPRMRSAALPRRPRRRRAAARSHPRTLVANAPKLRSRTVRPLALRNRAQPQATSKPGSRRAPTSAPSRFDTETNSARPDAGRLCGISLALAPNEACYIPLAHRKTGGGGGAGLFGGGLAPDQIPERDALAALEAAARRPRRPEDRAEPQIRLADVRAARHRDSRPTTTRC